MKECLKPSYNPFRMFGSYIGAVAGIISMWFGMDIVSGYILKQLNLMSNSILFLVISYSIPIILGFLIGYGIHSLIRKIKHNKCKSK